MVGVVCAVVGVVCGVVGVTATVEGLPVAEALVILRFTPRAAAHDVANVIKSPQTAVHFVSTLEEMPVQETLDGIAEIRSIPGMQVGGKLFSTPLPANNAVSLPYPYNMTLPLPPPTRHGRFRACANPATRSRSSVGSRS